MNSNRTRVRLALLFLLIVVSHSQQLQTIHAADGSQTYRIVLVAGETAKVDVPGHHDYLAGCQCLDVLLKQTPGVETVRVNDGWPADETVFDNASAVVFYTDGGGKQAFLESPERISCLQRLADSDVGIVMIHQAVDFPDEFVVQGKSWLGGVYKKGTSGRGHWDSSHVDFPKHAITRGVTPWKINDGWLNALEFVDDMHGVIPVVWSTKDYEEGRPGINAHIVSWGYERQGGGRSFSFTGLDAHAAWELPGMRQLVVNGILWSAGVDVGESGAKCVIGKPELDAMLTPREPKKPGRPAKESNAKKVAESAK